MKIQLSVNKIVKKIEIYKICSKKNFKKIKKIDKTKNNDH